jgi:hypothetical protein
MVETHFADKGLTTTAANDGTDLKYLIDDYQTTFCNHIEGGLVSYELHKIINTDGDLPELKRIFYPMDCKALKIGKDSSGREVIALILNYNGQITGKIDAKHFIT